MFDNINIQEVSAKDIFNNKDKDFNRLYYKILCILENLTDIKDEKYDAFEERMKYYESILMPYETQVSEAIKSLKDLLLNIRIVAYEHLRAIAQILSVKKSNLNNNYEKLLEDLKDNNKADKILKKAFDDKIKQTELLQEIAFINEIRVFIHQALNIHAMITINFVSKVLSKEKEKGKIIKDKEVLVEKIESAIFNLHRLHRYWNEIKNLKGNVQVNLTNLPISEVLKSLQVYKEKIANYYYIDKENKIILNINNKLDKEVSDRTLEIDLDKFLEIVEVILFNATEELINKEIEDGIIDEKHIYLDIYNEIVNAKEVLVIKIKDNGRGIKEPLKIFEMNYTTKKDKGGSGIGLATALKLAKLLNINIRVNTKVGKGSTFYIEAIIAAKKD